MAKENIAAEVAFVPYNTSLSATRRLKNVELSLSLPQTLKERRSCDHGDSERCRKANATEIDCNFSDSRPRSNSARLQRSASYQMASGARDQFRRFDGELFEYVYVLGG